MSAELRSPSSRKGHAATDRGATGHDGPGEEEGDHRPHLRAAAGGTPSPVPADPAPRTKGAAVVRIAYRALQIGAAVGVGYWVATARLGHDSRIDLAPVAAEAEFDPEAVVVTAAPVASRPIQRAIDAVGSLYGFDELTLKTKISGRVVRIYHDFADRVVPGKLLLELDPTDSQLAVEQAKRSLGSELAKWGFDEVPSQKVDLTQLPTVVSAKVRLDLAQSQLARLSTLQDRGSVTADELEQAKTTALVAQSDYANQLLLARAGAANAQLKKSELDIAEQQLQETKVYVPVRSQADALTTVQYTITDRYVTEGAWLAAGSDLFRLVIDDVLKLRLSIPEKFASTVRVGQRVEVTTLTASGPVIGKVVRIGPSVDPQTRTFQIEAEVPNEDGTLKTGGFAKARVVVDDRSSAQTVPTAALVTFAGVHKVFVLRGDRVAEYQVKLGEQTSEWVEIVDSSLPADAQVIVSGQTQLADGSRVRMRETESEAPANGTQMTSPSASETGRTEENAEAVNGAEHGAEGGTENEAAQ